MASGAAIAQSVLDGETFHCSAGGRGKTGDIIP